jgi:hypothetical protein
MSVAAQVSGTAARSRSRSHREGKRIAVLRKILERDVNVVAWQRPLPAALATALGQSALTSVFGAHRPILGESLDVGPLLEGVQVEALRTGLAQDLGMLVRAFADVVGTTRMQVGLDLVSDDKCRKFHSDYVGIRMLVSYAGPGTQWVEERHLRRAAMHHDSACVDAANRAIVPDDTKIRSAGLGDVLLLKGEAWPGNTGRGAVHRSPPIEGTGTTRLLFVATAPPVGAG